MKSFHTLTEMITLLEGRGLGISDESLAEQVVLSHNYYRLSGFFRQYQIDHKGGDLRFVAGTTLDDVIAMHRADRDLAGLLTRGLTDIECSVRARLAYFAAKQHGTRAFYLDPDYYYDAMPKRDRFLERMQDELARSKSAMVKRYLTREGDPGHLPIWVAVEVLPFGAVSKMIEYAADDSAARETAHSLSQQWETFASTVHSLAVLRNRCAHHGQIWHRRLDLQTPRKKAELRNAPDHDPQGTYPAILAIRRFLKVIHKDSDVPDKIDAALELNPELAVGIFHPSPK